MKRVLFFVMMLGVTLTAQTAFLAPLAPQRSGLSDVGPNVARPGVPACCFRMQVQPERNRVLVFGATGTSGAAVCAALRLRDPSAKVFAFVRDEIKAQAILPSGIEFFPGDMRDVNAVAKALSRSQARSVFLVSSNGPEQVQLETNVIAAAEQSDAELLVKLSTATPCMSPLVQSSVGEAHMVIEEALKASAIPQKFILRANYFMQNLLKSGLVVGSAHHPQQVRPTGILRSHYANKDISMVDVRDVAQVAAALLLQENGDMEESWQQQQVLEITGPHAVSMKDVAAEMSRVWGTEISCVEEDLDEALQRLVAAQIMSPAAAQGLRSFLTCVGHECNFIETRCVHRVAGRVPTPLAQFLSDYAAGFDAPPH